MNKLNYLLFILLFGGVVYAQSLTQNEDYDYRDGDNPGFTHVNWSPIYDAAGDWCPAGMFPDLPAASIYAASAWLGDTLYVQAPAGGTPSTTVYKYTYGGTWTTGVSTPVALAGGRLIACDGKLYLFGGGTTGVSTGTTTALSYDPTTGAWTTLAPMPVALSAHGGVCWGDSVIFIYGGPWSASAATTNLDVHYYRVASDTWGTITNSLPTDMGRRTFANGLVDGNKIIMCAGYNGNGFQKNMLIGEIGSDATQITWTMGPDVPTGYAGLSRPGGTGIFKWFFIVGGERAGGGYHDSAYVYDITLNAWVDVIAPKPLPCSNIFSQVTSKAFDDSVKIFAPGGYDGTYQANFDVVACGELLVIPVELTSFTASVNENDVTLNWVTATEVNNQGFEIERNSGNGFENIGYVAGFGTSSETHSYSFVDASLNEGTYSYRLKQVDLDGTFEYSDVVEVDVAVPDVFALEQNYPNPFNPSTRIDFSLAVDSKVSLKVFNVLGQEVANLISSDLVAGSHNVDFSAASLNSGVYFYRIEATGIDGINFTSVKKMILTK
jgi:hypothetical protein